MADNSNQSWEITDEFVEEWNRIRHKVDGQNGPNVDNSPHGITHKDNSDGTTRPAVPQFIKIKITGTGDGDYRYTGNTMYGPMNNAPTDLTVTDLGKESDFEVEVWSLPEIPGEVPPIYSAGDVVLALLHGYNKTTGTPIYLSNQFVLPQPQYTYMVLQGVAPNQVGYANVRAHPME